MKELFDAGKTGLESSSIECRITKNQMNQQSNRREMENIMRKIMSTGYDHAKKPQAQELYQATQ